MSISNCIRKTLNLKDENIVFYDECIREEIINNKRCLVYIGYLDSNMVICTNCSKELVKNGSKSTLIKMPKVSELTTYLELWKQRYTCDNCKSSYTSITPEIDYRCRISNNTKHSVINYSKEPTNSFKYTGNLHNICDKTVQRTNNRVYDNDKIYKHYLPENMCFDEFQFMKKIMSFNMCDAVTGKTFDIVKNRQTDTLNKYFSYFTDKAKAKVRNIVIDMYKPYISIIKDNFPNASIIIDLFHIVQLISKSMNKTRIMAMKKDKTKYNKMKRYWRLILKSRLDLDCSQWKKYTCFQNLMTEVNIVDYILNGNDELKNTYQLYQDILYALQSRDYNLLVTILNTAYENISSYMKTSVITLKEFDPYIKNSLSSRFSNGVMERNNNTIKLIKRIAFGLRNFFNFKARILVATSLFRAFKKTVVFLPISP